MNSASNPAQEPNPTIRPSEILHQDAVLLDLEPQDKADLVQKMVHALAASGAVSDSTQVIEDILRREHVMSTGIGGGIAVPHAQSKGAQVLTLALARLKHPIDFESLDARPVNLVFLLVGPDERGGFIRLLARISRLLYTGDLQRELLAAKDPGQVLSQIQAQEARLGR